MSARYFSTYSGSACAGGSSLPARPPSTTTMSLPWPSPSRWSETRGRSAMFRSFGVPGFE